jgi:hypothetical protein
MVKSAIFMLSSWNHRWIHAYSINEAIIYLLFHPPLPH